MIQRIVDSITGPMIETLTRARDYLDMSTEVAARGLNLDYFLGPVSHMGWQWRTLIVSILSSAFLLVCVFTARKIYAAYLSFKEGVKWW